MILWFFENDESMATKFLRELIFKHYRAEVPTTEFASADALVRAAFTQVNAFEELVIAAEGVPRDAINILSIAAQKALDQKISVPISAQQHATGISEARRSRYIPIQMRRGSYIGSSTR